MPRRDFVHPRNDGFFINFRAIQLNSERFRQDEFKGELSYRTRVGEHRRVWKNSLVSTFLNDAVQQRFQSPAMTFGVSTQQQSPHLMSFYLLLSKIYYLVKFT
ncbi:MULTISPECIES: palindromic element RPE3 domain-containing protein [unclassified Rickettsia]|uniref:palindromic element RPE3 domain-containing protein n=1 Tax=unclassified Rickettsia TaxID=114295 RepID=UPI003132C20F